MTRTGRNKQVANALRWLQALKNRPDLQTYEHEREHIENEHHGLPDGIGRNPHTCLRGRRGLARDGDRVADDGEDARKTDAVGEQPDAEGADELQDDRGRRITGSVQELHETHIADRENWTGNQAADGAQ